MNSRRLQWLALLTVSLSFVLTGCGPSDTGDANSGDADSDRPRIAFVSNGIADFWLIAKRGVEQAGEDLEVDVSFHMPQDTVVHQQQVLKDLVTRGVDGISVSPIDPVNQAELLNEIASYTRLITNDSDAPDSDRILFVGIDNYKAGRMCGELVEEALPDGGKVMIFVGRPEQDNARGRRQGLIDQLLGREYNPKNFDSPGQVLEGNGYTILGTLTDQFDFPKAKANVEDTLSRHPDIDGLIGLFAYNPPMILETLEQAGKLGAVKVIAFDEDFKTLEGIKQGTVHGTVVQDPYQYGYLSVELLKAIFAGDNSVVPENEHVKVPARHIRQDNVQPFWDDLKSKLGKTAEP